MNIHLFGSLADKVDSRKNGSRQRSFHPPLLHREGVDVVKGVLDWRVPNSGIDGSFRSPLHLHTLRTAPAQRAAVLAGLGRSLVQIKPPQLQLISFQLFRNTPQPSELTVPPFSEGTNGSLATYTSQGGRP